MATLDRQVSALTDGYRVGWISYDWVGFTGDNVHAGSVAGDNHRYGCGNRFLNITIPKGATITVAYLTFTSIDNRSGATCNSVIIGEDVDDATTFSTLADYKARRGTVVGGANNNYITSASVAWSNIGAWTTNTEDNSPEIKTIIQEIIDRAGWVSGNDMVLFWDDHASNSSLGANRVGYSYGTSTTKCAKLHIEYEVPSIPFRSYYPHILAH